MAKAGLPTASAAIAVATVRQTIGFGIETIALCSPAPSPRLRLILAHLEHPSGRLHSIRPMRKHIQPEPEEFATDSPLEQMRFERSVPAPDNAFEIVLFSYSGVPVPARNIVRA